MLPDVQVNVTTASSPRTLPTDTGQCFIVGVTQRGSSIAPQLCRSMQDVLTFTGQRLTTSLLYDWADGFFLRGGTKLWISRVFGAGAVAASRNLLDAGAGVSLVVSAGLGAGAPSNPDPGTWGNNLQVAVLTVTGGYQLQITYNSVIVETSPTLVTQADGVNWSANSNYVDVTLGATALVPFAAAAAALTGGTDGAAVADADFQAAWDRIPRELGPGQCAAPGQTTSVRQLQAIAHCVNNNRFFIPDLPDSGSASTLISAANALITAPNMGRRYAQPIVPWDVIAGLTSGSTRTIPASARLCADYAKIDALGNPNLAAAGSQRGVAVNTIDLSQAAWSDADRLALNNAGITVTRRRPGGYIATWGMRTLADQSSDQAWSIAANVRCTMAIVARFRSIGDQHEFDQIDGFGEALSRFQGDLIGVCMEFFSPPVRALYGATPADAFRVDVGPGLNTPASLQAGILTAQVALRLSPSNEQTIINVVRVPLTQSLA